MRSEERRDASECSSEPEEMAEEGKIRMLRKAPKQDRRALTMLSKLESGAVQIAAEAQHVKAVTRWRRWASGR